MCRVRIEKRDKITNGIYYQEDKLFLSGLIHDTNIYVARRARVSTIVQIDRFYFKLAYLNRIG